MTFMKELGVSVFNIDKSFEIILIALNFFFHYCVTGYSGHKENSGSL